MMRATADAEDIDVTKGRDGRGSKSDNPHSYTLLNKTICALLCLVSQNAWTMPVGVEVLPLPVAELLTRFSGWRLHDRII